MSNIAEGFVISNNNIGNARHSSLLYIGAECEPHLVATYATEKNKPTPLRVGQVVNGKDYTALREMFLMLLPTGFVTTDADMFMRLVFPNAEANPEQDEAYLIDGLVPQITVSYQVTVKTTMSERTNTMRVNNLKSIQKWLSTNPGSFGTLTVTPITA